MTDLTADQQELLANDGHWIVNLGRWTRRDLPRLDAILDEFGYERCSRVRWELAGDGASFLIRVQAFDLDNHDVEAVPVLVAVMDRELFSALAGLAYRLSDEAVAFEQRRREGAAAFGAVA